MSTDPEVLDKIKRACSPQKAIYDMAEYMGGYDADIIGAVDTANKASQDASTALSTVNTVRVTADNALSTANQASATASNAASTASAAQTAAENAQTTADKGVTDAANALTAANKGIADAANALAASNRVKAIADSALAGANAAVNGLDVTSDQSTVSVTATKNTGSPDVNSLPVASAASAGVMNSATFLAVEGLNSRVAALENEVRTYLVTLPNTTPTQAEITTAYRTGYPFAPNPPLDGTVVIDAEKDLYYQWVGGSSQWIKLSGQQIGMFTNSTLGTIKGSTTEGQISAEADGTGSLNGYDALKSGVSANTTAISNLTTRVGNVETKNSQQDTSIRTNETNIAGLRSDLTTLEGEVNTNKTEIDAVKINADKALSGVIVSATSSKLSIQSIKNNGTRTDQDFPIVNENTAGVITPAMYQQWNAGGGGLKPLPITSVTLNTTDKTAQSLFQNSNYTVRLIVENDKLKLYVKNDSPVTRTMHVYLFGIKGLNATSTTGLYWVRNLAQAQEATIDLSTSGMANYYEISWGNENHILYAYKIWQTNNPLNWPIYYYEQAFE